MCDELKESVKSKIEQEIQNSSSELNYDQLNSVFQSAHQFALQEVLRAVIMFNSIENLLTVYFFLNSKFNQNYSLIRKKWVIMK